MRRLARKIIRLLDGTPAEYRQHEESKERGQSLVEMAFITPIIIILIVGIAEIGWYANNYLILLEVTRVGARRGAVLSGEFSPLVWDNHASLVPTASRPGIDPDQEDLEASADGIIEFDRRELMRQNSRSCEAVAEQVGLDAGTLEIGFYNLILCQMLDSLSPLEMNDTVPAGAPEAEKIDDIIISVFSIQMVDHRAENLADPDEGGDIDFNTFYNSGSTPTINPSGAPSTTLSETEFEGELWEGYIPVVVGRYPSNANECNAYEGENLIYAYQGDERDPFDYLDDNELTYRRIDAPEVGLLDRLAPMEFGQNVTSDRWLNGAIVPNDPIREFEDNTRYEAQRGWVYTGYNKIPGEEVTATMYSPALPGFVPNITATRFCIGSTWSIYDIQELLRTEQFDLTQSMIDTMRGSDPLFGYDCTGVSPITNPAAQCEEIDVDQFYASQGLVLVEMYWEHELLLDLPGFNAVYNVVGGDTTTIYVWSAFPVATASPEINYWPAWEALSSN